MATFKSFHKPDGFQLPEKYDSKILENDTHLFIKKIDCEVPKCEKYVLGRYFRKERTIHKPTKNGLEEEKYETPICLWCNIYVPSNRQEVYLVGTNFEQLMQDFIYFSQINDFQDFNIDLSRLEDKSFSSGTVELVGHQYRIGNIKYTLRKFDGSSFKKRDPEFKSHNEVKKDILEVTLEVNENQYGFYVYTTGKITRRGRGESAYSDFQLMNTVYNTILKLISN